MARVLTLQKAAVRCLARKEKWVQVGDHFQPPSCRQLFRDLRVLTAPSCYIFEAVKFFISHGDGHLLGEGGTYYTRSHANFHVPRTRLRKSDEDVFQQGATFFNKLPGELKSLRGGKFTSQLRIFLVEKAFYSVAEDWNC